MEWKDVYKLPLKCNSCCTWMVFTSDWKRAFDTWYLVWVPLWDDMANKLIHYINTGETSWLKIDLRNDITRDKNEIYVWKQLIIRVRWWWHLIWTGWLNLDDKTAWEVMDSFTEYIFTKIKELKK